MIADLVFVLVLAGADDAVAGAIGDDVDACPVRDAGLDDGADGVADADVAEEREVGWAGRGGRRGVWLRGGAEWRSRCREPGVHVFDGVGMGAANGCDEVAVGKGGFDDRSADVACSSKYLLIHNMVSSVLFVQESIGDVQPILAASVGFEARVDRSWPAAEALKDGTTMLGRGSHGHSDRPSSEVEDPASRAASSVSPNHTFKVGKDRGEVRSGRRGTLQALAQGQHHVLDACKGVRHHLRHNVLGKLPSTLNSRWKELRSGHKPGYLPRYVPSI